MNTSSSNRRLTILAVSALVLATIMAFATNHNTSFLKPVTKTKTVVTSNPHGEWVIIDGKKKWIDLACAETGKNCDDEHPDIYPPNDPYAEIKKSQCDMVVQSIGIIPNWQRNGLPRYLEEEDTARSYADYPPIVGQLTYEAGEDFYNNPDQDVNQWREKYRQECMSEPGDSEEFQPPN